MQELTKTLLINLKSVLIVSIAVIITGCVSAKAPPTEEVVVETPEPAPAVVVEPEPEPEIKVVEEEPIILKYWIVAEGDNLWNVAAHEEVYTLAERWPLIYKNNLEQITDADLIYPGQVLDIPRDMSQAEIDAAVSHARNRGAWSLGPIEASDRVYIKNSSG